MLNSKAVRIVQWTKENAVMVPSWILSFAFAFLASAGSAQTVETIEKSFAVQGTPRIVVTNEDGRTELRSHGESRVLVSVVKEVLRARSDEDARRLADRVEVRIGQEGDRIEVQTLYPENDWSFWGDAEVLVHIDILAPAKSDLDVSTEDGRLTVSGFEGELRLSTEDGDLSVSACSGVARVSAEDGDVNVRDFQGDVDAGIEDGDLRVEGKLGRLSADAEDGDVDVRLAEGSVMTADWRVEAADGGVRIQVPEGFAADLDVDTRDGSIDLDLPATAAELSEGKLTGSMNGGGHRLVIRTEDGSVRLSKSY
jgi:ribosomal protein L6P/L9E